MHALVRSSSLGSRTVICLRVPESANVDPCWGYFRDLRL
jgi:hypothetical protein